MRGKESSLKTYILPILAVVCIMISLSVQVSAASGGYEEKNRSDGQYRYTITYDVVDVGFANFTEQIVCNFARKRENFDLWKEPAENYYDYSIDSNMFLDAYFNDKQCIFNATEGTGVRNNIQKVFNSSRPVISIDYIANGDRNKSCEFYITKVELEILNPLSDTASSGKKTLWAGKWGLKTGELTGRNGIEGVEFTSRLKFTKDGPQFSDWTQRLYYEESLITEELGENKTQYTNLSECHVELYDPVTTSGVSDLTLSDEVEVPKDNMESSYKLTEGILYDQLGAKWPCQTFEISTDQEDKHLSIEYKDGSWYLHAYPDSNAAQDYQVEITQHVLNGKDFPQKTTVTVHTFDYKFIFMDAGGKVIDTKTVDYGETVTPPDSSVTWTCNAYADWQNTKDGPQQRIVYSWDTQGKGTKDDPFLITSAAGWNNLRVKTENSGTKGEYYKLMNDISVKTTIGTKDRPFEGIFEGNGKTLTINYSNTDNDERTAPFAYTRDVTIRNLTIEGSIEGSGDHAAGVLGENEGWTLIRNCIVSASIKGGKYVGGFSIGAGGTLKIQDCAFYGLIIGTTDCGGFVAYGSDTLVLRDCLFAPLSGSSIQSGATFVNKEWDSLDECYYYTALGTPQGHEKVKESSGSAKEQEEMAKAEYDSAVASAKNLKVGNVTAKAKTGRKAVISWKKNKSADGYQIRYSPDKNFKKSIKFVNINKSKMKKTLTKLKAGKTWFVQIRTYKKIKNPTDGKTSTIYGKWSKVKKVKIKK